MIKRIFTRITLALSPAKRAAILAEQEEAHNKACLELAAKTLHTMTFKPCKRKDFESNKIEFQKARDWHTNPENYRCAAYSWGYAPVRKNNY